MVRALFQSRDLVRRQWIGIQQRLMFPFQSLSFQFEFALPWHTNALHQPQYQPSLHELLTGIWNMGVPKSKVSPSRKKMKHERYFPDRVHYIDCPRCGGPKRPHRICTKFKEICAMREEDWIVKKKEMDARGEKLQ